MKLLCNDCIVKSAIQIILNLIEYCHFCVHVLSRLGYHKKLICQWFPLKQTNKQINKLNLHDAPGWDEVTNFALDHLLLQSTSMAKRADWFLTNACTQKQHAHTALMQLSTKTCLSLAVRSFSRDSRPFGWDSPFCGEVWPSRGIQTPGIRPGQHSLPHGIEASEQIREGNEVYMSHHALPKDGAVWPSSQSLRCPQRETRNVPNPAFNHTGEYLAYIPALHQLFMTHMPCAPAP